MDDVEHRAAPVGHLGAAAPTPPASVVPPTSTTCGSASSGTVAAKTSEHRVEVLEAAGRCRPAEVLVVHVSNSSPTSAVTPALLLASRGPRLRPAARRGRCRLRAGSRTRCGSPLHREPDEQHVALDGIAAADQGVRADPLHPERRPVGQRLLDHRHRGHGRRRARRRAAARPRRRSSRPPRRRAARGRRAAPTRRTRSAARGSRTAARRARIAGLVGGVHASLLADDRVEAGLLADLADDGVPRVLPVVDAAPGQGPLLAGGDPRRGQPRQQDALVAHDDGVRRHALSPGQGHGLQSRPRPRDDRTGRAGPAALWFSR